MTVRVLGLILAIGVLGLDAIAQPLRAWAPADTLFADDQDRFTYVPAPAVPPDMLQRGVAATFEVEYVDFPPAAEAAFQRAVDIWSQHLESPVPIRVRATWEPASASDVLGATNPRVIANFTQAPEREVWYAVALANALAGQDLDPDEPHIRMSFNSELGRWYFGTDGLTPSGLFDLVTIVLHELGHGLGFVGSMLVENEIGSWGIGDQNYPIIFDRFAERGTTPLLDQSAFPNPSRALGDALTSESVYFSGPRAVQGQGGTRPELHAPPEWVSGSSYSHLSEQTVAGVEPYPPGTINSLMTPTISPAEAVHAPGPVVCGMFADLGWSLSPLCVIETGLAFSAFTAIVSGSDIVLTFRLGDENGFVAGGLERMRAGGVFEPVNVAFPTLDPLAADTYSLRLPSPGPGEYTFRLRFSRAGGPDFISESITARVFGRTDALTVFPNPVRDEAVAEIVVRETYEGTVRVYDTRGRVVRTLVDGAINPSSLVLHMRGLAAGVYVIRVESPKFSETVPVTVLR